MQIGRVGDRFSGNLYSHMEDLKKLIREVDHTGKTVWELRPEDLPGYKISNFQIATRLPNGNTLLNNWVNIKAGTAPADGPVQALEVTPDKKIVWALRSWADPSDLGPATTILEGLAIARTAEIDAAILDVNVRSEPVFPIADLLKERKVPIIYATGYGAEAIARNTDARMIEKPYTRQALVKAFHDIFAEVVRSPVRPAPT